MSPNQHRFLVFSSVGDWSKFPRYWLKHKKERQFSLWVCYYGKKKKIPWRKEVDYFVKHQGGKYQNLAYVYQLDPSRLESFEAVMVIDDDIQINTRQLNRLFTIRQQYQAWIVQPSFSPRSKISWEVTQTRKDCKMRWTNFIEMNTPLFEISSLLQWLSVFQEKGHILTGWGVDLLYMFVLGWEHQDKYIIVDDIACVNPHRSTGIGKLQSLRKRKECWSRVRSRLGIEVRGYSLRIYKMIKNNGKTQYPNKVVGRVNFYPLGR